MEQLTENECRVVEQLRQGLSNKQIAAALSLSEAMVKQHLFRAYRKLGVTSRGALIFKLSRT